VLRNKAQFYRVPARYVFSGNASGYANVYNCKQLCLLDLTQREFDLAVVFLSNVGRVLPREELLASVWVRDTEVDTRTVDTHASRLRKKLGLGGESGLMLSSVYGQGYRLDTVQQG
jgi:DNA-binding response OmpR family regulator